MKKRTNHTRIIAALAIALLMTTVFGGCGAQKDSAKETEPVISSDPISTETSAVSSAAKSEAGTETEIETGNVTAPEAGIVTGRQNGERCEDVIILEGIEETVKYEHVRNDKIGIELDYAYESFNRQSASDCERFVFCYDDPADPQNYFEVTCRAEDADTAAASISEALSKEYDIIKESQVLDHAGSCIHIDASCAKGGKGTPDLLQAVYIIPAADGCRVATVHYTFEAAEGIGSRIRYIMNTLVVIESHVEKMSIAGTWQTATMEYTADGEMYPEYYVRFNDSTIDYGHMKNGVFESDHSNKIVSAEEIRPGKYKVQAETADGKKYTYQTCEEDDSVLEYFETWNEDDFPTMYRGGESLSRIEE